MFERGRVGVIRKKVWEAILALKQLPQGSIPVKFWPLKTLGLELKILPPICFV